MAMLAAKLQARGYSHNVWLTLLFKVRQPVKPLHRALSIMRSCTAHQWRQPSVPAHPPAGACVAAALHAVQVMT